MRSTNRTLLLIPILGIIVFIILYIIATFLYPGGSQVDKNSVGFSWVNNYWCNLLNEKGINGQDNPAKPVAITAMFIFCLALSYFWYLFPKHIPVSRKLQYIIPLFGILSMIAAFFLLTNLNHDLIIDIASILGLIAIGGVFIGLYRNKCYGLFSLGLINIVLIGLNNYVYYTKGLIVYLPVVQKITFSFFLFWIGCIDYRMYLGAPKNVHVTI